MIRAEFAGESVPELIVRKTELRLNAGVYAVHFAGEESDRGTYQIGERLDSHTMILRGTTGLNSGRTIPCIFQFVGNLLRICYGLEQTQPSNFTTQPGQRHYLATYRRVS